MAKSKKSTRFSHRHLLALGTFLVPLMVLTVLGWNELQRSGDIAMASLDREAKQFLKRAQEAITHSIDLQVGEAMAASRELLLDDTPTRNTIRLREVNGFEPLLDILLIDNQAGLVWPRLPSVDINLPMVSEPTQADGNTYQALAKAAVLMKHGHYAPAKKLLNHSLTALLEANPPNADGRRDRSDLLETEIHVRMDLGALLRYEGNTVGARKHYHEASIASSWLRRRERPNLKIMADVAIAELGESQNQLQMLKELAEGKYDHATNGMTGAVADRLAERFQAGDPRIEQVERYLNEIEQLSETRAFASKYALVLKSRFVEFLKPWDNLDPPTSEHRIVHRLEGDPALLAFRPATEAEQRREDCSFVALHFNLEQLIAPVLATITVDDIASANYALAITDPNGEPMVTPEHPAPAGYDAEEVETKDGLTLRVLPANPGQLVAQAQAAKTKRILLVLTLLLTALGGALWSWRSVSREAELANLKISLVSRVSHELKTPLALIRMYGETIGMGRVRDGDQAAEFGTIIARESERLTTLIQRILDFSRQQAGTLTYKSEPYDIGELLRTTAYAYAPHLEEKGVILIDSLPLGLIVSCDKDGLEGAIVNLLENATKYGFEDVDEHEVDLLLQRQGDYAVVEVQDRGRGIPAKEHKRIFEGFYRASNSGEVRGAGLGLGIVQHFVRAHDGDIEALPREGGGTIMRLTLPLAKRNTTPPSQAPNRTPGTPT